MATKAGDIFISMAADFARFRDDMVKVGKLVNEQVGGMKADLESISGSIEGLKHGFEGLIAALGVRELISFVTETIEATAKIKDQADAAGVTTQAFQALQYAASQTGTSQETMTTSLTHMTRVLGDAAGGSKQAQQAFSSIGVSIRDANGNLKASQTVFRDVAEALSRIPSVAQKGAAEVALFGKSGQQMGSMFEEGAAGLDKFAAQAQNLGIVFDQNMIVQAQKAQAAIEGLTLQWNAFLDLLVAKFTPQIMEVIKWLAEMLHLGEDTRMSDAIADTNELIKKTNDFLDQEHAKLQQIAGDWAATGVITAQQQADQLKAENAILEAMKIRQRLQDNLDEMGERHRDSSLKKDVFSGTGAPTTAGIGGGGGASSHKSAIDQATKDFEKQAAAIASVEQALLKETAQATMNTDQIRLDNALRQANVGIRTEAGQRIAGEVDALNKANAAKVEENRLNTEAKSLIEAVATPQQKYNDLIDEYNKLLAKNLISQQQYDLAVGQAAKAVQDADPAYQKAIEEQQQLQDAVVQAGGAILNDLGRAFTDSGTAADRWKNFVSHAIQDVMSAFEGLAKQLLTGALNSLFGGAGGATLGSIFGGGSSAILGPLAGSPMVLGGGGGMGVGDWAIVGERGPELVYADTPGNVLSADRTRGIFASGSGGGGDTHFHIDARGADMGAVARMELALREFHRNFETRAVAAVAGQRKRGGTFASTFNR